MSCYGSGSTSRLSYIAEVTRGTTPAGDLTALPFATHNLNLTKEELTDPTLYGDRMERNTRHGNRQVAGEISAPFRADNYDDFLESVMQSTWDATPSDAPDELKIGSTLKTFSIEDYDSTVDYSLIYTGCIVNSFNLSTSRDDNLLSTSFGMLGFNQATPSQTERTVAATIVNEPLDNYSGTLEIGDTGGSLSELAIVTSFDFTIENNITPTFAVGSNVANCFIPDLSVVTGNMTVYYKDVALLTRFLNETETAINFTCNDSGGLNEYRFFFPRTKLNGAPIPVEGSNERLIQVPFRALRDTTEESSLVIYRPDSNPS